MKIINLHALFGEYVDVDEKIMAENPSGYFSEILPEEFCEYMTGLDEESLAQMQFDRLIIDEGQDILKPSYLLALDYLLRGGFENGKWTIFYDEKQNIYNSEYQEGMELILSYPCTKFCLFINCRNTVQIGTYGAREGGLDLHDFIREYGEEVQKIMIENEDDFHRSIKELVKKLQSEKIRSRDILFLSPKRFSNSMLSRSGIKLFEWGDDLEAIPDLPAFSTVQGYKGLDSKIVVLVDIDEIYEKYYATYMYIAATRARTLLYVVGSREFWQNHNG